MKRPNKDDIAQKLQHAQLTLVEKALVEFVERIDGKVPTDETILREGHHATFSPNELSVYEKDGKRFSQFYIWRRQYVLAIGFLDSNDLLTLYVAEVPTDERPTALRLFMENQDDMREKGPEA